MKDFKESLSKQQRREDARTRILRNLCKVNVNARNSLLISYIKKIFLAFGPIKKMKWQPNIMSELNEREITIIYEFPESAKLAKQYLNKTKHFQQKIVVTDHEFSKTNIETLKNIIANANTRIFLVGFYTDVEEEDIKNIFETDHRKIHKCYWAPNIGEIAGYAFIEFNDNVATNSVLNTIKEFSYKGFKIKVGGAYSPSRKLSNSLWLTAEEARQYALTFAQDIVNAGEQQNTEKIIRKISKIHVENTNSILKKNIIKDIFLQFGPIKVFKCSETSDKYIFIEYEFPEAANLAMLEMGLNVHFSNIVEGPLLNLLFNRLRSLCNDTIYIAGIIKLTEKQLIMFLRQKEIKYKKIFYLENTDNFAFIQLKNADAVSNVIKECNKCKYKNSTLTIGQAFFKPDRVENEKVQWNRSEVIKTLEKELELLSTFNTDELQMGAVHYPGYEKLFQKYLEIICQSLQACSQGTANYQYCVSNLCFTPEDCRNFKNPNTILIPQHLINEMCEIYLKTLLRETPSEIESNILPLYSNLRPLPEEGKYLQFVHNYSYIQNQQLPQGMMFLVTSSIHNPTYTTTTQTELSSSTAPTNVAAAGDEEENSALILQSAQTSTSIQLHSSDNATTTENNSMEASLIGNIGVKSPTEEKKKQVRSIAKGGPDVSNPQSLQVSTSELTEIPSATATNVPTSTNQEENKSPILQSVQTSTSALTAGVATTTGNVPLPTEEEKNKARQEAKRGLNLPLPESSQTTIAENIKIRNTTRTTSNYDIVSNIITQLPSTAPTNIITPPAHVVPSKREKKSTTSSTTPTVGSAATHSQSSTMVKKKFIKKIASEAENSPISTSPKSRKLSWKAVPTKLIISEDCFKSPGGTRRQKAKQTNPKQSSKK